MTNSKIERWMSFEAWRQEGYFVIKGQKSILRSPTGTPLFSESQVEEFEDLSDLNEHRYDIY